MPDEKTPGSPLSLNKGTPASPPPPATVSLSKQEETSAASPTVSLTKDDASTVVVPNPDFATQPPVGGAQATPPPFVSESATPQQAVPPPSFTPPSAPPTATPPPAAPPPAAAPVPTFTPAPALPRGGSGSRGKLIAAAAVAAVVVLGGGAAVALVATSGSSDDSSAAGSNTSTSTTAGNSSATDTVTSTVTPTDTPTTAFSPAPTTSEPPALPSTETPMDMTAVADDTRLDDVASVLDTYFSGINAHDARRAVSVFTPDGSIDPNSEDAIQHFQDAIRTTRDTRIVIEDITPSRVPGGPGVLVRVAFRSHQAADLGPGGNQSCTDWELTEVMRRDGGELSLLKSQDVVDDAC